MGCYYAWIKFTPTQEERKESGFKIPKLQILAFQNLMVYTQNQAAGADCMRPSIKTIFKVMSCLCCSSSSSCCLATPPSSSTLMHVEETKWCCRASKHEAHVGISNSWKLVCAQLL
mmetsp:Transcript_31105/g.64899  ORF Transcript_31105/g.64899 Transcript_31105/m.64899 type:complete len:116 (-) Transcript_31105:439-786(-)